MNNHQSLSSEMRLLMIAGAITIALVALVVSGIFYAPARAQATLVPITAQLDPGESGANVTALQTLLALNGDLYPSHLVTGYFGPLTAAAVKQFQIAYGIAPVGRVGPQTLAKMNALIAANVSTLDIYAPGISNAKVSVNGTSAAVSWDSSETARGTVYYSAAPIVMRETSAPMTEPYVSGTAVSESDVNTIHSVTLSGLAPGTTYQYVIVTTDLAGNVTVTLPATFTTQ